MGFAGVGWHKPSFDSEFSERSALYFVTQKILEFAPSQRAAFFPLTTVLRRE